MPIMARKPDGTYEMVTSIPIPSLNKEVKHVLDKDGNYVYKCPLIYPASYAKQLAKKLDGTPSTYKTVMKQYFDFLGANSVTNERLTYLCNAWYEGTRDNWNGWTTFSSTTGASAGTRGGDNAGKTCVPSTDVTAGQDDFAGLPLFYPIDVNWVLVANGDIIITGIDGITSGFERTNPAKLVGVMQQSAYHWESHTDNTFTHGYSAQPVTGKDYCDPLPECYNRDGTFRQFMVHSKYQGFVDANGYMRCYSGVIPTAWMGADNAETACKKHGSQYGCESITFLGFLEIMSYIKYASLSQDGINQGCVNYNYQYASRVAETGVKRILITTAQAANLRVGCGVLVGTVGSNNNVDRGTASVYSISAQRGAKITDISEVTIDGTTYAAVTVDTASSFNTTGDGTLTTGNTMISTFAWPTGINDSIKGNDGAKASPGTGKYPAKIQGIEYAVGCYETYGDIILQYNPADDTYTNGYIKYYVCNDAKKRSTSTITSDYYDSGLLLPGQATANWYYIKQISFSGGVCAPTSITGASSSTYYRDAMYVLAKQSSVALGSLRSFGSLYHGVALGGLSYVGGSYALSDLHWSLAARPSANASWGAPRA